MNEAPGSCKGYSRWTQPWVLWGAAGSVTGLAVAWVFHSEKLNSPSRIVLGFLPALLWIICVVALVRKIRTSDEMVKRIQMEAASIAFVATIILNYVFVGLDASLGLDAARIYTVEAGVLGAAGIVIWAVATAFLTRRYR